MKIFVEGNVGAGKSTLLDYLQQRGYTVVKEPTHTWKYLERYYQEPSMWAFHFTMEVIHTHIMRLATDYDTDVIYERSIFATLVVFTKALYEAGTLSQEEYDIVQNYASWIIAQWLNKPHVFIYLDCKSEECQRRVMVRESVEKNSDLDFFATLEHAYENLLAELRSLGHNVHIIDAKKTVDEVGEQVTQLLEEIA